MFLHPDDDAYLVGFNETVSAHSLGPKLLVACSAIQLEAGTLFMISEILADYCTQVGPCVDVNGHLKPDKIDVLNFF